VVSYQQETWSIVELAALRSNTSGYRTAGLELLEPLIRRR
jgi:hypothetical protein